MLSLFSYKGFKIDDARYTRELTTEEWEEEVIEDLCYLQTKASTEDELKILCQESLTILAKKMNIGLDECYSYLLNKYPYSETN